jgi:hypothetical protein
MTIHLFDSLWSTGVSLVAMVVCAAIIRYTASREYAYEECSPLEIVAPICGIGFLISLFVFVSSLYEVTEILTGAH